MGGAKHASRTVSQGMVRYLHFTDGRLPAEGFVKIGGVLEVAAPEEFDVKLTRLPNPLAGFRPRGGVEGLLCLGRAEIREQVRGNSVALPARIVRHSPVVPTPRASTSLSCTGWCSCRRCRRRRVRER